MPLKKDNLINCPTHTFDFLRAYAVEIGVDPEETLEDLEVYLGNKTIPKNQENIEPISIKDDVNTNNKILNKEDNKQP